MSTINADATGNGLIEFNIRLSALTSAEMSKIRIRSRKLAKYFDKTYAISFIDSSVTFYSKSCLKTEERDKLVGIYGSVH